MAFSSQGFRNRLAKTSMVCCFVDYRSIHYLNGLLDVQKMVGRGSTAKLGAIQTPLEAGESGRIMT